MIGLKKYNYILDKIIGIEYNTENNRKILNKYFLDMKSKVIRRYHDSIRAPKNLICTYIDMEKTLSLRIKLKKETLNKLTNIQNFIKTKIYTEYAASNEIIEYIFKYQIVELKNNEVSIEVIFLPKENFYKMFEEPLNLVGYIDYISFPAFSYKALYQNKNLEPMRDIFIILLWDKTYITAYQNGQYMYNSIINFGLEGVYNELLNNFEIEGFNKELFFKILQKKGVDRNKYFEDEEEIHEIITAKFSKLIQLIKEEIKIIYNEYDIDNFDRLFITTNNGNIYKMDQYLANFFDYKTFNFYFYEKYNLDKLPISNFLYLSMIETYYSYKNNQQDLNFSLWLRPPTFFYKPTGKLIVSLTSSLTISIIAYTSVKIYQNMLKNQKNELQQNFSKLVIKKQDMILKQQNLKTKLNKVKKINLLQIKNINKLVNTINEIKNYKIDKNNYKFYNLLNIIEGLKKYNIKIFNFDIEGKMYKLNIYSKNENDLIKFFKYLEKNKWKFKNKIIKISNKNYIISNIIIYKGI